MGAFKMAKILLVEDNEMNRDMLSRRLIRKGHEILTAIDGEEGVRMTEEIKPDLVLMDVSLPIIDGLEATRRIRNHANDDIAKTPVIALTAHAMEEDRKKALDAGCNDFDTKPVDLSRLLDKIQGLLA
jgi:two-component system, cell cycle response regulator DivK